MLNWQFHFFTMLFILKWLGKKRRKLCKILQKVKQGKIKKEPSTDDSLVGGSEQIRTAVEGFADLCLATRPRNLKNWLRK